MTYQEALFSPDLSLANLTQRIVLPQKLYKYQSFHKNDGTPNPFWQGNMNGEFHTSLACEFEDEHDCMPHFNKETVSRYIDDFLQQLNTPTEERKHIIRQIDKDFSVKEIIDNYQKEIRIGCFTRSSDNEKMWIKYANDKRGYCIEYDTSKNRLFKLLMLPVLYSDFPYDASYVLSNWIILESIRQAKQRSLEENSKIYNRIYKQNLKMSYISLFIKEKGIWEFEQEYRMFILKHINTRQGLLEMDKLLDKNFNLDLSDSITAIYLGESFFANEDSFELLNEVKSIANRKNIRLVMKSN